MADSPFSSFRTYELSFTKSTAGGGDPKTGNFGSGTSSTTIKLRCTLKASSDPRIVSLAGADGTVAALSGRCVDPMSLPNGLRPGLTSPLIINGVTGVFTLGPTFPSAVAEVEEAIGQKIVGTWKAGAAK